MLRLPMLGPRPISGAPSPVSVTDPNALLQHIDQTTTMVYHWVRAGIVVTIVLLILVLVGF